MKITIINGNPTVSAFDAYLEQIKNALAARGNAVDEIVVRDTSLKYCTGCWNCWVKTPGICSVDEESQRMGRAVINADFVLWAAPLKMGFPSFVMKMANDKHLPLIHPYIVLDQGEAHHLPRYEKSPRLGLLVEKEASTDAEDLQIVTDIYCRTALNFKSRLDFSLTTETPVTELVNRITQPDAAALPLPARRPPTRGASIAPPTRLTLFNGSPRGRKGNTPIFLTEVAKGFGGENEMHHLIQINRTDEMVEAFRKAECVLIGFPLYTDSMPASVKHFIEALEPLVGQKGNPPLGFVVQSGFPEGNHSRYVEHYVEKLARRLGSPYLGTIVKGNGEGTRLMPPQMNRKLFEKLNALGKGLASGKGFDPAILAQIAKPERYPKILRPLVLLVLQMPFANFYFNDMLKKNGAYDDRFAQPFLEKNA